MLAISSSSTVKYCTMEVTQAEIKTQVNMFLDKLDNVYTDQFKNTKKVMISLLEGIKEILQRNK